MAYVFFRRVHIQKLQNNHVFKVSGWLWVGGIFFFLFFSLVQGETRVRIYRQINWWIFSPDQTRRFSDLSQVYCHSIKDFVRLPARLHLQYIFLNYIQMRTALIFLSLENICFNYCRSYKLLLYTPVKVIFANDYPFWSKEVYFVHHRLCLSTCLCDVAIVILADCKKLLKFLSNLTTNIKKLQMSSYHQFVTESFQSRYCRIILSLFVLLLLFYIFLKTPFYCYRI
jgi:hypothetical protein